MQALRQKAPSRTLAPWPLAVCLGFCLGACLGCGLTEPPPDSKPLVQGTEADRVRRTAARAEEWRKEAPEPAALPRKTPEDLARERREWEEHQKIVAEREAAHQAVLEQWRRERAGKAESAPPPKVATPGAGPVAAEDMRTWHASYAPKAVPVRSALARYLPVARKTDLDTREICQSLEDSTTTLLQDGVLASPDRRVSRALQSAYKEFQGAAEACLDGNPLEAHFRLRDGEAALRRAASLLEPYSLRP